MANIEKLPETAQEGIDIPAERARVLMQSDHARQQLAETIEKPEMPELGQIPRVESLLAVTRELAATISPEKLAQLTLRHFESSGKRKEVA